MDYTTWNMVQLNNYLMDITLKLTVDSNLIK